MTSIQAKQIYNQCISRDSKEAGNVIQRVMEVFWFLLSFILFVILGPFAAPVALLAIFRLGLDNVEGRSPEPLR